MSMFCYQCQETAIGTGCTLKGVCGKTSEVANLQDLLLFVVRGIAVYNEHLRKDGHPSEQADKFIYDALFSDFGIINRFFLLGIIYVVCAVLLTILSKTVSFSEIKSLANGKKTA